MKIPFFTILDRYLVKELIGPFVFGVAAFSCILAGSSVLFYLIGDAIKYGIPIWAVVQLFVYKLPNIIVFAFPMSMLLATIIAFGRLSSDLEIMALRAGGVGFARLIVPVVCVGFFVSILTIWFNESVVPRSSHSAEILIKVFTEKNEPHIKQNINFTEYDKYKLPLRIINVQEVDRDLLKHITVAEYETGKLARVVTSETGKWLKDGGWEFYQGVMHCFSVDNPRKVLVIEFKKELIDIQVNPLDFTKRTKNVEEMTSKELLQSIHNQKKLGQDPIQDIMKFHMKFSIPFASLIFSLLGASVGLRPYRSSSALGLGISLVVILIYYVLLSIGMGLGMGHVLPPLVATWIPNCVVGLAALYLLKRIAYQ